MSRNGRIELAMHAAVASLPMHPTFFSALFVAACGIASAQNTGIATYSGDVGPLIERKCVHCHRPGGIAPMAFMSYAETREWSKKSYTPLDALVRTRGMPPWPADPAVGDFANREFMTEAEIDLLLRWIAADYPRGDGDYVAPAPQEEWELGEPDVVVQLAENTLARDDVAIIRPIAAPSMPDSARWIVATEIRPGNPYIVRGVYAGPFGNYQPGQSVTQFPAPYATRWDPGQSFAGHVHYVKDPGVEESDHTRIGLHFANDDAPRREVLEARMRADDFTIPAGDADFQITVSFTFPESGEVIALMPNLHTRGKRVTYTLETPAGAQTLLEIPEWNPNWKYRYVLRSPIAAPEGSIVTVTAHFDNSEANLKNPDPWSDVASGPEGETLEGWLSYTLDGAPD